MQAPNPEYIGKIIQYIIHRMSEGKTWNESFMELGKKAGIENFNPENPKESEMEEMARHI